MSDKEARDVLACARCVELIVDACFSTIAAGVLYVILGYRVGNYGN